MSSTSFKSSLEKLPSLNVYSADKAKITRKRSKPDKNEHGNGRARKEPGESYQKSKVDNSSQPLVNLSQTTKRMLLVQTYKGNATLDAKLHSRMGFLHLKYTQKKHKGVTSWIATLAIRVKQRSDPTALGKHPMIEGMYGQD
ncbi:hypothetical protein Tco_0017523 [Tanacetum coccineum]